MKPFTHPEPGDFIMERVLYALSDPVRLGIVRHLARVPEASCNELGNGRPKSSMSHHFRVLRDAGLVRSYSVGTTHMNSLRLDDMESRYPGLLNAVLSQTKT
ncbi:ArsR/SmtB family transcription factor [Pollutimonas harenae]|uniref:Helix-turn-helix transcriptional regulator n=1 Tax=Pollutimonas harenae TaxID=657015 RepID=A0A853GTB2_9BURK|nr:helix-turn-helix domain-containing protein [Pollutimonas harenae]NYT84016.1 helix-turn-helix transcriptional regulator [Pollutimonas harenae]TEA73558.1 ArsR family transcriptional regulator [Pollutimonas harenae]